MLQSQFFPHPPDVFRLHERTKDIDPTRIRLGEQSACTIAIVDGHHGHDYVLEIGSVS